MARNIKILLVGNPNVGKSALFNALTGRYVAVSNYPGTTVEVTEGFVALGDTYLQIIDTPGMYSMLPISDEEKVARDLILFGSGDCIVNVVDAKNLERMLPLTFQLIETGLPVILVLNMMDEAERSGIRIDVDTLSSMLGIPVIPAVSIKKLGTDKILDAIMHCGQAGAFRVSFDSDMQEAVRQVEEWLKGKYTVSKRFISHMLLQKDSEILFHVSEKEDANILERVDVLRRELEKKNRISLDYLMAQTRQLVAVDIVKKVATTKKQLQRNRFIDFISRITIHRIWGYLILAAVLYFGLYKFVGVFGAGFLVDFIEESVFEKFLLPGLSAFIERNVPYDSVKELLIRDYGIITLGLKYAIAIIFPIVTAFFLFFSVLEDSGYLPRLALLMDRSMKKFGMTGRAVIPLVLGFGCDTMATMVTRTLTTRKERIIATVLLALAIPCSAQLGVMLAVLSHSWKLLSCWIIVLLLVFVIVGYAAGRLIAGEKSFFFVEIPPVRIPKLSNIFVKTYTRLVWYFKEVIPLFIYASFFIWIGRITGLFDIAIKAIAYPLQFIELPREAAQIFLFGFFRRDYGAAGLYDMHKEHIFDNNQLLVMSVILTLFLPCIAQLIMTFKERGVKTGLYIAGFVLTFSLFAGYLVYAVLKITGVSL